MKEEKRLTNLIKIAFLVNFGLIILIAGLSIYLLSDIKSNFDNVKTILERHDNRIILYDHFVGHNKMILSLDNMLHSGNVSIEDIKKSQDKILFDDLVVEEFFPNLNFLFQYYLDPGSASNFKKILIDHVQEYNDNNNELIQLLDKGTDNKLFKDKLQKKSDLLHLIRDEVLDIVLSRNAELKNEKLQTNNFITDFFNNIDSNIIFIIILGLLTSFISLILGVLTNKLLTSNFKKIMKKEEDLQQSNTNLKELLKKEMIIKHIHRILMKNFSLIDLLTAILREISNVIKVDRIFILLSSDDEKLSQQYISVDDIGQADNYFLTSIKSFLNSVEEIRELKVISDVQNSWLAPEIKEVFQGLAVESLLIAPISYKGKNNALLLFFHDEQKQWDDKEKDFISMIVDQSNVIIQHYLLFEKVKNLNDLLIKKEKELIAKNTLLQANRTLLREKNLSLMDAKEDLKFANEELIKINNCLIEINTIKSDFVSTVSHELRTPLTSIRGSIDLVLNGMVGDYSQEVKVFLTLCQRNTDRLINIINDLLDISKMESGELVLKKEETNIKDIVMDSIQYISGFAITEKVNIKIGLGDDIAVFLDRERIMQVMNNLLSNAIKFSTVNNNPSPLIIVNILDKDDCVQVDVIDNGVGIKEEDQHKVFEKFTQIESTSTRNREGTGLGLSIVKAIIEKHKGNIFFKNNEDKGVTCSFTLSKNITEESVLEVVEIL